MLEICEEHPLQPDLTHIFARHSADMHAETPPGSVYMLGAKELAETGARFFVIREAGTGGDKGTPVAMGAIKAIDPTHAELKSMHVLLEARGRGLARQMLEHLIIVARAAGFQRLSLETGREPLFLPAETLYRRAGFVECGPFGDYSGDPNSLYMTLAL